MIRPVKHIAIIGSGNVATYMASLFTFHGFDVSYIISRNKISGEALAKTINAAFSEDFQIHPEIDLVMLCVNDDELANVSDSIEPGDYIVCHCAGAQSIDVLEKHNTRGVIYPLQSINAETDIELTEVPFLIEGSSKDVLAGIERLLNHSGKRFFRVNSEQRLKYHLAAVFANNFTNAMFVAVKTLTDRHNLDFDLLQPIISETFSRLELHSPEQVQTGPAKRNDRHTLQKHLNLLEEQDEKALYEVISDYIGKKFKI